MRSQQTPPSALSLQARPPWPAWLWLTLPPAGLRPCCIRGPVPCSAHTMGHLGDRAVSVPDRPPQPQPRLRLPPGQNLGISQVWQRALLSTLPESFGGPPDPLQQSQTQGPTPGGGGRAARRLRCLRQPAPFGGPGDRRKRHMRDLIQGVRKTAAPTCPLLCVWPKERPCFPPSTV